MYPPPYRAAFGGLGRPAERHSRLPRPQAVLCSSGARPLDVQLLQQRESYLRSLSLLSGDPAIHPRGSGRKTGGGSAAQGD